MAVIKVCSETLFNKKSYHIEIGQLICEVINLLVFIWCEFLLKDTFKQIIALFFFKDMLISKKQSNIDSLKISLTLPFRLNNSKWKAVYWVEYYVNCYVYFNTNMDKIFETKFSCEIAQKREKFNFYFPAVLW